MSEPLVGMCPLRVSVLGGGTDMPEYLDTGAEGICFSFPIDKYVYAVGQPATEDSSSLVTLVGNADTNLTSAVCEAAYEKYSVNVKSVHSFDDVETMGTGLGSSSAWVRAVCELFANAHDVIRDTGHRNNSASWINDIDTYNIERSVGARCGYQDHAAAYWQLPSVFRFIPEKRGCVIIKREAMPNVDRLASWIHLYRLSGARDSNVILAAQGDAIKKDNNKIVKLDELVEMCNRALGYLYSEKMNDFAEIVRASWEIKKDYAPGVTNDTIEEAIIMAYTKGAAAAKLLGAGGAGYLMVMVNPNTYHARDVEAAMMSKGYKRIRFNVHS